VRRPLLLWSISLRPFVRPASVLRMTRWRVIRKHASHRRQGAAIRPTHKRFEHGSYTCGGSEICAIVMDIKDGLPTPCERLSRRLQPMPVRAGAISRGRQGPLLFRLFRGGPTFKSTLYGLQMEESVEPGPRAPLVAAASPVCPKCKTHFRFSETLMDVRRDIFVRLFRCECGQVIWDEKRA